MQGHIQPAGQWSLTIPNSWYLSSRPYFLGPALILGSLLFSHQNIREGFWSSVNPKVFFEHGNTFYAFSLGT